MTREAAEAGRNDRAAIDVLNAVAKDLRDAWRESGACANLTGRATVDETSDDATACASCGLPALAHRLLKWAERLERAAKETR